jgi:hypothetical protein
MDDIAKRQVLVVIVSYGRPGDVVACVAALQQSEFAGFEVAIVENAGSLAVDQLCATLAKAFPASPRPAAPVASLFTSTPGSTLVKTDSCFLSRGQRVVVFAARENLGYAGGVNAAIGSIAAAAPWCGVWILNPDTIPDPRALAAVKRHAETGGYGLVGCRVVFADNSAVQIRGGMWRRLLARGVSIGIGDKPSATVDAAAIEQRLQWVSGVAAYATREFIETVGPMSERYFLYCEDVDWSLRGHGFRLGYAHPSIVYHAYGNTIGSAESVAARSALSVYLTERNKLLLTRTWFPMLYPLVVAIALLLSVEYWFRGNRKLFAIALRGLWAGIRGETGRPAL